MPSSQSFEKGFLQRAALHLLPEGSVVDAVNVLNDELGALMTRRGHQRVNATPLAQAFVHSLGTLYTASGQRIQYQGAGSVLYRDFAPLLSGLSGSRMDMVEMRGFQESRTYTFFANGDEALRVKDDGQRLTRWGIDPPQQAVTVTVRPLETRVIDTFESPTVDTDYTLGGAGGGLGRSTGLVQEGDAALQFEIDGPNTAHASKVLPTPLDLTGYPTGVPSREDDAIRIWVWVERLNFLDRLEVGLNYDPGSQFNRGYYLATIFASQLGPGDATWTEVKLAKTTFQATGTVAETWAAINGVRLTLVGNADVDVFLDTLRLEGGAGLRGHYRATTTHARKAQPARFAAARLTPAVSLWLDTNPAAPLVPTTPLALATTTVNSGHAVGADTPFAEVVYGGVTPQSGGTPVYAWSYWNGASWVAFTPDEVPTLGTPGVTRVRLRFPSANWQRGGLTGAPALYWIRMLATTPPTTQVPQAQTVQVYDGVVSARSNAGPVSEEFESQRQPVTLSNLPNPALPGPGFDPQVTHIEIYRTVGEKTGDSDAYLFERDVPVGTTTVTLSASDTELLDILEHDNHRPLPFQTIADHQERIFGAIGNAVYFSKARRPESFPPTFFFEVSTLGDPVQRLRQYGGILYVWTLAWVYEVTGSDERSYFARRINCPTGLGARDSITAGETGLYFYGRDANWWLLAGQSTGQNISDPGHYPMFHGERLHNIPPLTTVQAEQARIVAGSLNRRIYLAYQEEGHEAFNHRMLVIDESTGAWHRDSRGFQALYYDRQRELLLGGTTTGLVMTLDTTDTDDGTAITSTVVTRQDDEQAPDADKQLLAVTVDSTLTTPMTVEVVVEYQLEAPRPLGTVPATGQRRQQALAPAPGVQVVGKALGFVCRWQGPGTLYRLIAAAPQQVLVYPKTVQAYGTLAQDMGWPGVKVFLWFALDIEVLDAAGTATAEFWTDGLLTYQFAYQVEQPPFRTRTHRFRFPTPVIGRLLEFRLNASAPMRVWPGTMVAWVPLGSQGREQWTPLVNNG